MPRHFVLTTFAAGLAAIAALDAQAAQPGFYVGGAYLETSSNARQEDFDGLTQAIYDQFGFTLLDYASTFEDEDSGYEILGGYRLLEWLAFEVGYLDLGAVEQRATAAVDLEGDSFTIDSRLKSETQGLALTALGIWQATERLSLFARGGFMLANTDSEITLTDGTTTAADRATDSSEGLIWGVGAGFEFADIYTLRLEYREVMDVGSDEIGDADIEILSLGLTVAFAF